MRNHRVREDGCQANRLCTVDKGFDACPRGVAAQWCRSRADVDVGRQGSLLLRERPWAPKLSAQAEATGLALSSSSCPPSTRLRAISTGSSRRADGARQVSCGPALHRALAVLSLRSASTTTARRPGTRGATSLLGSPRRLRRCRRAPRTSLTRAALPPPRSCSCSCSCWGGR